MCTTMRYHGGIGTGGRYHLYYHVYHVFLYRRRYFIDTIEQPDRDRTAGLIKTIVNNTRHYPAATRIGARRA